MPVFQVNLAHLGTLDPQVSLAPMERLAKRDLLENQDLMALLARRVTPDLQDRRESLERRGEPACREDLARAAPWALLGHQGLLVREATQVLQGLQGPQGCQDCQEQWQTQ